MSSMKESDVGVVIRRVLVDDSDQVINLSGASDIRLDVLRDDGTVSFFVGGLTTPPGTDGEVEYTTTFGDFPGGYHYQLQFVVKLGSKVLRSDRFHLYVEPAIKTDNP